MIWVKFQFLSLGIRMQFKGRSLYNLLKITLKEDPTIKVEPWQIENYRTVSDKDLLNRLQNLGISLTQESFLLYSENCDTPEDLLECLSVDESDLEGEDKVFLILFELWRRWIPEKQSLSIFCDELDDLILLYDDGLLANEDPLQEALSELEDILDQGIDHGANPQEIFQSVMGYMAHDVEQFLYDYVLDLMESSNELYASELIDGMGPYVAERKWFDLLKARLFSLSNSPEMFVLLSRMLEQAEEEPDLVFLIEMGQFLTQLEDVSLFMQCSKLMMPLIQTEEDLLEVLELITSFARYLDKELLTQKLEHYVAKREKESKPAVLEGLNAMETFLADLKG